MAFDQDRLVVEIDGSTGLLDALRNGRGLKVRVGDHNLAYDLAGVGPVVDAVERCVGRYAPTALAASPATGTPKPLREERDIAGWTLTGSKDGPDGVATCVLNRADELGPILGIAMQGGVDLVFVTLSDSRWDLKAEASYDISYAIDDGAPTSLAAKAVSESTMLFVLGQSFAATEPLRHASKLDFRAPETIALFDLSGSANALDGLRDCAERYGIGTKSPTALESAPAARSKPAAPARAQTQDSIKSQVDAAIAALWDHPWAG
jgi:hypothetical protein